MPKKDSITDALYVDFGFNVYKLAGQGRGGGTLHRGSAPSSNLSVSGSTLDWWKTIVSLVELVELVDGWLD